MKPSLGILLVWVTLGSCRSYDLESRVTDQGGLLPADKFARYGREQAEEMAIAREYGRAHDGSSPADLAGQAETAIKYAHTLPDVVDIKADPLGYRLTIRFKSGWRTMVTPIDDGKRGDETVGLPPRPGAGASR